MKGVVVYKHYNGGTLLYVGISKKLFGRISGHASASEWFDLITNITVDHFPDEESARVEEARAIREERPLYNIIFNGGNPDKARVRKEPCRATMKDVEANKLLQYEIDRVPALYSQRWGIEWIADFFGTTTGVIKLILRNRGMVA